MFMRVLIVYSTVQFWRAFFKTGRRFAKSQEIVASARPWAGYAVCGMSNAAAMATVSLDRGIVFVLSKTNSVAIFGVTIVAVQRKQLVAGAQTAVKPMNVAAQESAAQNILSVAQRDAATSDISLSMPVTKRALHTATTLLA